MGYRRTTPLTSITFQFPALDRFSDGHPSCCRPCLSSAHIPHFYFWPFFPIFWRPPHGSVEYSSLYSLYIFPTAASRLCRRLYLIFHFSDSTIAAMSQTLTHFQFLQQQPRGAVAHSTHFSIPRRPLHGSVAHFASLANTFALWLALGQGPSAPCPSRRRAKAHLRYMNHGRLANIPTRNAAPRNAQTSVGLPLTTTAPANNQPRPNPSRNGLPHLCRYCQANHCHSQCPRNPYRQSGNGQGEGPSAWPARPTNAPTTIPSQGPRPNHN